MRNGPEDSAGLIVCKVPLSSLPVSCFQKGALLFFLPSLKMPMCVCYGSPGSGVEVWLGDCPAFLLASAQ